MGAVSLDDLRRICIEAREAGRKALQERLRVRYGIELDPKEPIHYDPTILDRQVPIGGSGGSTLVFYIDGRTATGKLLKANPAPVPDVFIIAHGHNEFAIGFRGIHNCQIAWMYDMVNEAAREVFERELGVKGFIRSYSD